MCDEDAKSDKLHLAETPEEQRLWMAQWRSAEAALLE